MLRLVMAGMLCALAPGAAMAQPTVEAPQVVPAQDVQEPAEPPVTSRPATVVCTNLHLDRPMTSEQAAAARTCLEAIKLKAELDAARNSLFGLPPWVLGAIIAMLGTAATLLPTGIGYLVKHLTERKLVAARVDQERGTNRAAHIREFLSDVGDTEKSRQYFGVAGLLGLIEQMQGDGSRGKAADRAKADSKMLLTVLFSRLHDEHLAPDVSKQIVDGIGRFLVKRSGKRSSRERARQFHLREFNCQAIRVIDAYWGDIDASETDFFDATLTKTSFRNADLRKAVFYKAKMTGAVLCEADLRGANFQEALLDGANFLGAKLGGAKLDKADLRGALNLSASSFDTDTTWTEDTKWPQGFQPPVRAS